MLFGTAVMAIMITVIIIIITVILLIRDDYDIVVENDINGIYMNCSKEISIIM